MLAPLLFLPSLADAAAWCSSLEPALASLPPERVWSWYTRGVGLMLTWVLCILARQITAVASSEGIFPVRARFERIRADFSSPLKRFLFFPSYLHLCHADWVLPGLLYAAGIGGGALVFTGAASRTGLFLMWSTYLSYANVMNFMYPWDCLMLEMGFLSLFLPSLEFIGSGSWLLSAAPAPLLAFSIRYLLFRLMFGFGKFKFIGMKWNDLSYLQGFLINQPIPTVLGWWMHKLPLPLHVASYLFLFLVEIPGPFLFFVTGWGRLLGFALVVALQIGINLTGTFGYFNALTTVLAMGLLDVKGSLWDDFHWGTEMGGDPWNAARNVFLAFLLVLHCFYIPFNSWCSQAFLHWPSIFFPEGAVGRILRLLSPWHISHAYGVFFPHSSPPVKWIPQIEGTDSLVLEEGLTAEQEAAARKQGAIHASEAVWKSYTYKFMVTSEKAWPRFVAPYHPRVEHAILYEALGMGPQTHMSPLTTADPYEFVNVHMLGQVCAALLRENRHAENLFRAVPFGKRAGPGGKRVRAMRVAMYTYTPTAVSELLKTGRWWQRNYSHPHIPQMTLAQVERGEKGLLRLREPECWHPEMIIWQRRTDAVRMLLAKLKQGGGPGNGEERLSSAMAAHSAEELVSLRRSAAARASSTSPIYSFVSVEISVQDVGIFFHDFVLPLQGVLRSLRCDPSAEDRSLHPLQNGSRNAGLSDDVLMQPRNTGFKVDRPWNSADPAHWSRLLREVQRDPEGPWALLDRARRDKNEKILARLTLLLLDRILAAGVYHGPGLDEPSRTVQSDAEGLTPISARLRCPLENHLHLPSFYHLHVFAHHIIGFGVAVYERILRSPQKATEYLASFSLESGMFFRGLFDGEMLSFQARKRRMMARQTHSSGMVAGGGLPGFLPIYYEFMREQFPPEEGDKLNKETFPFLDPPRSTCEGWRVHVAHMDVASPGKQIGATAAEANGKQHHASTKKGL